MYRESTEQLESKPQLLCASKFINRLSLVWSEQYNGGEAS